MTHRCAPKSSVVGVKPKAEARIAREPVSVSRSPAETAQRLPAPSSEFIVIKRDRAKYNAYMRAYRARKKKP